MADKYPGPFCELHNITKTDLQQGIIKKPVQQLLNGIVIEISHYLGTLGHNSNDLYNILVQLDPLLQPVSVKSLKVKVTRICEQKKKLSHKKKVAGVKNVGDLLNALFSPPSVKVVTENKSLTPESDNSNLDKTIEKIVKISVSDEVRCKTISTQTGDLDTDSLNKATNLLQYENSKLQKQCISLSKKLQQQQDQLTDVQSRTGHYSVRNVNKRDDTAKKNLHALRNAQRLVLKQDRQLEHTTEKLKKAELKCEGIEQEIKDKSDEVISLQKEVEMLQKNVDTEKGRKLSAQKYNSYLRNEVKSLRAKLKNHVQLDQEKSCSKNQCENCQAYHEHLAEKENELIHLRDLVDNMSTNRLNTKNESGSYSNEIRLCVVELSGLEVAVEKVSEVIRVVSKHLFNVDTENVNLPSSSTVQSIVDEGHYLAKTFISHQLSEAENWGLNRDGTTRRRQKILDTSVSLSTGDIMSLGFNRVDRETAVNINDVTKSHLQELADLHSNIDPNESPESYIASSLEKLAFTMSDRASNEKKAVQLLDEWRDEILKQYTDSPSKVHHFYCMAHVLLGFHNYICADLKTHEKLLTEEHGPLGRDNLPAFKFWNKKGTVVERLLRTTSEVFGPSGDHHGVRDLWEAHCAKNGLKSVIGNYKDNRFNALFQTAAEVFHHRKDFIAVLETVVAPNMKLQSVLMDLKSEEIMTIVQCLGLFYLNFTGPYWNLIVQNKVPYLMLQKEVCKILEFLQECEISPVTILQQVSFSEIDTLKAPYHELLMGKLININEKTVNRELLYSSVKTISAAMKRTVEKQLVDFLNDGQFNQEAEQLEINRTNFAQVTNLSCEHHFGDLDSSQRRRPSASLHHHSSIQLLKRNRNKMMSWLRQMPQGNLSKIMTKARKGGKLLRQKHQEHENNVISNINTEMLLNKAKKDTKKRKAETNLKNSEKSRRTEYEYQDEDNYSDYEDQALNLLNELPTKSVTENEYVAIAYQDAWYPGIIVKVTGKDKFTVRFMSPCKKPGHFSWPCREDVQTVDKKFLIASSLLPDCKNSGRLWFIKDWQNIDEIYKKYSNVYF